jgi:hypothetical protein
MDCCLDGTTSGLCLVELLTAPCSSGGCSDAWQECLYRTGQDRGGNGSVYKALASRKWSTDHLEGLAPQVLTDPAISQARLSSTEH